MKWGNDRNSEDHCGDADGPNRVEKASTLVITSCERRRHVYFDDESSGSDSEGILDRMLNP